MNKEPKILHLVLKKKWFVMIASGEKEEEYRDISMHYLQKFIDTDRYPEEEPNERPMVLDGILYDITINKHDAEEVIRAYYSDVKSFGKVCLQNGYASDAPRITLECLGLSIGEGKEKWGAIPSVKYFIIKLGKIL